MTRFEQIEAGIRSLPVDLRKQLAVNLATLVLPFAKLSRYGQPDGGLAAIAAGIAPESTDVEVEHRRHKLWSTPELTGFDEPDGPAFFSLGVTITWIYAADSLITSPTDGPTHTFKRVLDLLGYADDLTSDLNLVDGLCEAVERVLAVGDPAIPPELHDAVRVASGRLASPPAEMSSWWTGATTWS